MNGRRSVVFLVVVMIGLDLYLPLLSRNYDLNGMAEAAGLNAGGATDLFLPNHMLYRPLGYAVRLVLSAMGVSVGAVPLLQVLSAIFGALGLGFVFLMLDQLVNNRRIAFWVTLMLGVSWSYWTMSTDIYYLSLSAMFVAAAMAVFMRSNSTASFAACGILAGFAILSFQANVFLLPGLSIAILLARSSPERPATLRRILSLWLGAGLVVGAAFVTVGVVFYERRTIADLLVWGSSYSGKALPMWGSWSFQRLVTVVGTSFKSVVGMELWMFDFFQRRFSNGQVPGWVALLGALGLAAALIAAFRWAPIKRSYEGRTAAWLLVLYFIYVPFFAWWDSTEPRWFNLSNIFIAGIVAIIASRWSSMRHFRFALPALCLLLGAVNFATSAWPRRFVASNPVKMAACVAENMHENDLFLATEWNWAGYLEYVHDRDVLSFLGEVSRTGDKKLATEGISNAVVERQKQNRQVYIIDVNSFPPDYQKWFTEQTGLTRDELRAYKGTKAFECVFSPFMRLDPL